MLEQARCDPGRRHAGFVDHQHDATSEAAVPVGGAGHGVQRVGRDSCCFAQLARGPRRRRDPSHLVSGLPVGVGEGAQHRRLAGSGQRLHRVHAVPAGGERPNRRLLVLVESGVAQGGVNAATLQDGHASVAATGGRLEDPVLACQQANRRVPRLPLVVRGELLDARVGEVLVGNELEITEAPIPSWNSPASSASAWRRANVLWLPVNPSGPDSRSTIARQEGSRGSAGDPPTSASSSAGPSPCSAARAAGIRPPIRHRLCRLLRTASRQGDRLHRLARQRRARADQLESTLLDLGAALREVPKHPVGHALDLEQATPDLPQETQPNRSRTSARRTAR